MSWSFWVMSTLDRQVDLGTLCDRLNLGEVRRPAHACWPLCQGGSDAMQSDFWNSHHVWICQVQNRHARAMFGLHLVGGSGHCAEERADTTASRVRVRVVETRKRLQLVATWYDAL